MHLCWLQVKSMESTTPGINDLLRNAKLQLKKSKRVDYYKLLEISQDANDYDIKKVGGMCSLAPIWLDHFHGYSVGVLSEILVPA